MSVLSLILNVKNYLPAKTNSCYIYSKANYSAIETELNNVDWNNCLESMSTVDEKWKFFLNKIDDCNCKKFISRSPVKNKFNVPWVTKSVKKLLKN